jgi:hypothetical protein
MEMLVAVSYHGERERAEAVVAEIERPARRGWAVQLDQSEVDEPRSAAVDGDGERPV